MKRKALTIGISECKDPLIGRLRCPDEDSSKTAIQLGQLGFQAIELLQRREATLCNVTLALKDLAGGLGPEDLLVFYFAGHGTTRQDGTVWLACWDAVLDTLNSQQPVGFLGLNRLVDLLREWGPFNRLIITDACRDNIEAGRSGARGLFEGAANYRNLGRCQRAERVGHVLLNACEDRKQARELERHGLFTAALLQLWEEKHTHAEPIWINANFRDQLGARMQTLAKAHGFSGDEQWPLFVEGRSLPYPLNGIPVKSEPLDREQAVATAQGLQPTAGTVATAAGPPGLQKPAAQKEAFCGVCSKRILTTLDVAGRCQYGGCHEPICNACWMQQKRTCSLHIGQNP